jgi:hypothetical protein
VSIVQDSYRLDRSDAEHIGIEYSSVVQIDDRTHSAPGSVWIERGNARWLGRALQTALQTRGGTAQALHSPPDHIRVDESGPEQEPYINITNERPAEGPHGGYAWFAMTAALAAKLSAELAMLDGA